MPKSPEPEGSPRLITIGQIAEEHGVSRSSVHTYRRSATFPQPVPAEGSTRIRYRAEEVAAWFEANPPKQGKRTDLAPPQPQGEPVTTTIDARSALYAFAMQGKEHSPDNSEKASEKINAFRTASLNEAVEALRAKAQKLSAEAETEMRRDLEDQAQVWHDAAELVRRLARKTPTSEG